MKARRALKLLAAHAAGAHYPVAKVRRALATWQRRLRRLGGYNPLASTRAWRLSYQLRGTMLAAGMRPGRALWRASLATIGARARGERAAALLKPARVRGRRAA